MTYFGVVEYGNRGFVHKTNFLKDKKYAIPSGSTGGDKLLIFFFL
jgi:hypothetical protein